MKWQRGMWVGVMVAGVLAAWVLPGEGVRAERDVAATSGASEAAAVRGNVVVADAFGGDETLAATRVTMVYDPGRAFVIAGKLAEAVKMRAAAKGPTDGLMQEVDFRMDGVPWVEAFLSLQARGEIVMAVGEDNQLEVSPRKEAGGPGVWCVAGPFAMGITEIRHGVMLGADGKPLARLPEYGAEELMLSAYTLAEPKLKVLAHPARIVFEKVEDELGHSLIPTELVGPAKMRSQTKYRKNYPANPPVIDLQYPAGAGKRIKVLKGTMSYLLEVKSETVVLEDPFGMKRTEKTIGGMVLTFQPAQWDENPRWLTVSATFRRGTMAEEEWERMKYAVAGMRPRFVLGDPGTKMMDRTTTEVQAFGGAANFKVWLPAWRGPGQHPEVTRLELDVPTEVREVLVPVEFRDLPLP